jgi:hypothetical protein
MKMLRNSMIAMTFMVAMAACSNLGCTDKDD